jgi:hypothetical protein
MRVDVKRAYETFVLATVLELPESRLGPTSQRTCIPFVELIGRIAFNHKLNDSVVNFSLQLLASEHSDVVVVDSLNVHKMRLPHQTLAYNRLVCFPLLYEPDHWCILFAVRESKSWLVWGYDPPYEGVSSVHGAEMGPMVSKPYPDVERPGSVTRTGCVGLCSRRH